MWVAVLLAVAAFVSMFAVPGSTIFILPLLLLGLGFIGLADFRRRRKQAAQLHHHRTEADSEGVRFTDEDRRTLSR